MEIEYDPAKDIANRRKHGLSLGDARDLVIEAVVPDERFEGEQRYRMYGTLDGKPCCLAAVLRGGVVRAISFRRAHTKEYRRHAR